jgi:hypothetical protein
MKQMTQIAKETRKKKTSELKWCLCGGFLGSAAAWRWFPLFMVGFFLD